MAGRAESASFRTSRVVPRPALYARLSAGLTSGVTLIAAPAGSGKSVLLRAWIDEAGLSARTAWVPVDRGERDPQHFWLTVVEQLRVAVGRDGIVHAAGPAPEFDGDALVRRLAVELDALDEPLVLVIDDLHELRSPDAQDQLDSLLAHRPRFLHVILSTRHDPALGLHRLRLSGELTELRAADLRLSADEARQLLEGAGIELSAGATSVLVERTEGWAAGLRLAAMSLPGQPDPDRFVSEFAGSDRTVADYLLAEVLERQSAPVRQLLLRTSILERVCGPLADALTGAVGSERLLLALEDSNAFVVSLGADRTWFRYHPLFADLLRLELRRTEPEVIDALHREAAAWLATHGEIVAAVRHAQAAGDWERAATLLIDHGLSLVLEGKVATLDACIAGMPAGQQSQPEPAALLAVSASTRHSPETADAYLRMAERQAADVRPERRSQFSVLLAVARLDVARRQGDLAAALREVGPLLGPVEADTVTELARANDARALALMNLGIVELWSWRLDDAARHLEQALALGRQIDRPYIQAGCLAHLALHAAGSSIAEARRRCAAALAIIERHGWNSDRIACVPPATLASADVAQARFGDARHRLDEAERSLRVELDPATALLVHLVRGELHLGEGRLADALDEFHDAERLQDLLATPHALTGTARVSIALTKLRMGDVPGSRTTLERLAPSELEMGEARMAIAAVRLAAGEAPMHASAALAPVLDGTVPIVRTGTIVQALLVEARARDMLGDAAGRFAAVERALAAAESDSLVLPFIATTSGDLLERHERHRTAHGAQLAMLLDVLAGSAPPPDRGARELSESLSETELRVLRYLPSNLTAPEIAAELVVSTSTVKTHMRHIYEKLDAHRRTEAVARARALGLLGPAGTPRSGR